jgi:hypothetical protein
MRFLPSNSLRHLAVALASALVFVVALTGVSIPAAVAQGSGEGTFAISPSRRDLVGRPPLTLDPTRVSNTTQDSYDVRVFPVLLRQDLTGAFQFDETPPPLNTARRILHVSPLRFQLAPGESREVGLGWELLPLGARAAYLGVVFQGQRRLKGGRSVPVISRLLSINFLRLPGRYHPNGVFSALHATQFAPRVLRILPRVRNTGDIIDAPRRGRLAITDATGRTVYRTRWPGDVILPRAEREFPIDVRQILPAGSYTAHATMSFGANRRAETSTAFTLIGPNQLPTPALKINDFAAHGEIGDHARVGGHVQSAGTAPANLDLTVSLFRVTGGLASAKPLASRQLHFSALAPGSKRTLDVELNTRLKSGQYHVVARYTDPTGAPQQLTSDFAATPHRGLFAQIRQFFDRHTWPIILVITLIAVAVIVSRLFRRQRRLEAELRAAKARRGRNTPPSF